MGSMTRFSLTWYNKGSSLVTGIDRYTETNFYFALWPNGTCKEPTKWQEHKLDLQKMSEKFPGVLFHLQCDGEDNQYWDVFAENGKIQSHRAKIVRTTVPNPKKWR